MFSDGLGLGATKAVVRARSAVDAAEALIRSLKLTTITSSSKRGIHATGRVPRADAVKDELRLDHIEALVLCGTLSSLEMAVDLVEHEGDTDVMMEELRSRTVEALIAKLARGVHHDDDVRLRICLARLSGRGGTEFSTGRFRPRSANVKAVAG